MAEKTKRPGRVKHRQGLADYLALGPDRSLEKLFWRYAENMLNPPALVTLKLWSAKHSWQLKATAHDERHEPTDDNGDPDPERECDRIGEPPTHVLERCTEEEAHAAIPVARVLSA